MGPMQPLDMGDMGWLVTLSGGAFVHTLYWEYDGSVLRAMEFDGAFHHAGSGQYPTLRRSSCLPV